MTRVSRWSAFLVAAVGCIFPPPARVVGDAGSYDAPIGDAALLAVPPSCIGLVATCGPSGADSCCTSLLIPGGTYYRGYDKAGDGNSGDITAPATVSDFRLDKYEVTVGRFRAFVNSEMGTQQHPPITGAGGRPSISGSGWDAHWNSNLAATTSVLRMAVKCDATYSTWNDAASGNENRPMNCITWFEAMAFCVWDGGFLPTEAEWNYAATGGDEQRAYPWSRPAGSLTLDAMHASYNDGTYCVGDGMQGCAVTDLVPVGTKPAGDGRWLQSDLAGNVWEWTLDWYAAYPNPCISCANTTATSTRVLRGGSFRDVATGLRLGTRDDGPPETRNNSLGVRCARTP
jgi:formylglycine-generating enzyme